ncbi:2-C-methyl-D-erythritol 4-phosphate cytidylyltransferase [Rhodococcus ruber]|uniref:2-C-methyl-D-erythritol 4-phosphate cytidylyltransferase n=1 Tax=Rhodococcus ruber TaxID=1830 RepID=A0A098BQT0_9NOCA|nr:MULTISPECIES: 2-C-methyl-D-erythritol 4-phosphate cytidylyltransferase [Rhodococcus]RIK13953.1 MAG: 2-C-methyl-D-erythritol 4-phosphate cytidylyltransferase [Acidobacteriota bacterium]ATQ30646.1 2-C-methyl-D-erythritol 4-phosphate cytidylyltransferase [Rhodococcus ruber]AUM16857.1 2-C-methyl-D-erythritol 4-phosphate cytidylyltransferase [Rhodococcus ruber]AXY50303.1 2-C-methyl-D-erythritol 4-phosphate cytidylyltransferase [Rhodococcus ruber]MBD8056398.1 2-C-methyl-D-erythritol 4-phosphate c
MNDRNGPVVGIIPAAGRGVRLGESLPKAFVELDGRTMLDRAVEAMLTSAVVDRVVVVVPPDLVTSVAATAPPQVQVVAGGAERTDSVRAGLAAAEDAAHVLVHDAARALTPPELFARIVAELRGGRRAVIPVLPVADTVKSVDGAGRVTGTPDRSALRAVQTPQGFAADLLRRANAGAGDATDDAGLVERLGESVYTVPGEPLAFKITTPLDLVLARAVLAAGTPVGQES